MRWLGGIIDSVGEFEQTQVKVSKAWCAAVHGVAKNWTQLND